MQRKKRFREIFIWDAEWFMSLSAPEKLFWYYINDKCDNIGVWEPNMKLAQFHIGSNIDEAQFFERVNKGSQKLKKRSDGSWFILDFVKFQYARNNPLNPNSPSNKSYLQLMKERELWDWFVNNYPEVMEKAIANPKFSENSKRGLKEIPENYKDKETDKETDKNKEKDKSTTSITNIAQKVFDSYPNKNGSFSDISVLADIENIIEDLQADGIKNPEQYLLNEIEKLNRRDALPAEEFFMSIKQKEELPF